MAQLSDLLSTIGPVDLSLHDSRNKIDFDGSKSDSVPLMADLGEKLADQQETLFANGRSGETQAKILLVLQGMDTSGKGGIIRNVAGLVDPQGLDITAFKKPTEEELAHDFLWRIERALPEPGMIGIFDRSHYEDVLIGRVRELAPPAEIERRYDAINEFEQQFVDGGGVMIKCFLHITADDQLDRLNARLDDPSKHWKFTMNDIAERKLWTAYQEAYEMVLERCSTPAAPWHIIPGGRKWYRNWAVANLLSDALGGLGLAWPPADFDVDEARTELNAL